MSEQQPTILDELKWRGLVYQTTPEAQLNERLKTPITVYVGFDPTADSLHIGSLLQIQVLRRFQLMGHKVIALVGGGTGLIGDPSGKSAERVMNSAETVNEWTARIQEQLTPFLDFSGDNAAITVSNYDWLSKVDLITYLRDVGKYFSVNEMLAKDSVKSRIDREGTGISYTEFSYMILQSFDYWKLFTDHGCELQFGGSDQWGNIIAGVELIRKKEGKEAFAMTFPLITTADGKKFGKSEGNAVWLDPNKTSPFAFYQFWLNSDDSAVISYLKYYTFLTQAEISELAAKQAAAPEKREAQQVLASELTKLVHGEAGLIQAQATTAFFFGDAGQAVEESALESVFNSAIDKTACEFSLEMSVEDILAKSGLSSSKSEARRDIASGGIYLNNIKVDAAKTAVSQDDLMFGKYLLVRKGKRNYKLCELA